MATHRSQRFEDLPEDEIRHLVENLSSLCEGDLGVSVVVACGTRAVPFLREALLYGRPSSVADGRRRMVHALAELGAKDVLLEYLRSERQINDPVLRLAEETVESAAARVLAKWRTDEVFEELLYMASRWALPGVLEGLAAFGRPEAIPYLIRALEDDIGRRTARDVLHSLGAVAWPALIQAAQSPTPSAEMESPSSLLRRRTAVQILDESRLPGGTWAELRNLLQDIDEEVAATAARIALRADHDKDVSAAVRRLCAALGSTNWLLRSEVEDCLAEHFDKARRVIEIEIIEHESGSKQGVENDQVLARLRHLRQRALNASHGGHH